MNLCDTKLDEISNLSYKNGLELFALLCLSFLGYVLLKRLFQAYRGEFLRARFSGADMNKPDKPLLPEAQGVLVGAVFLVIMFFFIPVPFWRYLFGRGQSHNDQLCTTSITHESIFKSLFIKYLAGLLCICCMVFLGFVDDALDLRWRHKCILPCIASLPLLMVYLADEGTTTVVMPIFLRNSIGVTIDIGILYYVYMALLTVFCTNAINIYSGINGLEVGQSMVIACSIIVFNLVELRGYLWRMHLFSLYFLIPFVILCWALYKVNRYPASVFVGDTFCYFAGVTLAVVGILGHFSKTLMLFFIPQIVNFLYSTPQLFAFIPCPRHRLPWFDSDDGLLHPSKVRFHPKSLSSFGQFILNTGSRLGLIQCHVVPSFQPASPTMQEVQGDVPDTTSQPDPSKSSSLVDGKELQEEIVEVNNLTLINFFLRIKGPTSEANTTRFLLIVQLVSSCVAFFIRYPLAWMFYGASTQ